MTDLEHPDALAIDSDAPEAEQCSRCGRPESPTCCAGPPLRAPLLDMQRAIADGQVYDEDTDTVAPRKKRRKGTSPTARTLAECRRRGWIAGVVERHSPFPKPHGMKHDFLGVIDLIAVVPAGEPRDACRPERGGTLGIQACSDGRTGAGGRGSDLAARRDKILAEPRARAWVEAGNRLEIWAWGSRVRGKGKRWTLRVEVFTSESWSAP